MNPPLSERCTAPWVSLRFMHDGSVWCCCFGQSVGNIYESTIDDIWNGDILKHMRRCISSGRYHEAGCPKDCPWLTGYKHRLYQYPLLVNDDTDYSKNLQNNLQEYSRGDYRLNSLPIFLTIIPGVKCNLRCIMCIQDHSDKRRLPQYFFDSLKEYFKYAYSIQWAGGEVLTMKEAVMMLTNFDYKENPHAILTLITNGTLLDEKMLNKLTRYKFINIIFSIDGVTPETYERIRPGAGLDSVISNLKKARRLEIKMGEKGRINWSYVVMKSNFREIPEAIRIANELGIRILLYPVYGDFPEENWLLYPELIKDIGDWQSTLNKAKGLYREGGPSDIVYIKDIEKILSEKVKRENVVEGVVNFIKDKSGGNSFNLIIKELKEEDLEAVARRLNGLEEFPAIKDILSIFDHVKITDPKYLYRTASFFENNARYELSIILFQRVKELLLSKDYEEEDIFLKEEQDYLLAGLNYHLGAINFKTKNFIEAKRYFDRCLERIPDHRMAREYLGKISVLNP